MRYRDLFKFMHERHQIYLRRMRGEPKPWTKDPILRAHRFTNAYRELDKITIWIRENWRDPNTNDPEIWFAMAVARYINWPETLEAVGYPVPWNRRKVLAAMKWREAHDEQVFGGAYFLNSIGPKIPSIVNDRLNVLWKNRKVITQNLSRVKTLHDAYEVLKAQFGFGTFMAAQVIADIKHTAQFSAGRMLDWWTWAASGPGSRRGMARLLDRPLKTTVINYKRGPERRLRASWKEDEWFENLQTLHGHIALLVDRAGMPALHAQDLQGWLCEFDKYERCRLGEGRPKQKYAGE